MQDEEVINEYIEKENYEEFIKNLNEALEQSERDFEAGRYQEARKVFKELRRKYNY